MKILLVEDMECYPERLHPQERKKIAAIASSTNHTIRLVEDLLLLARMDSVGYIETHTWVKVSVTEILEDLLELFQSSAQEKNIILESNLLSNIRLKGDGAELARLFRNILENALQYTPSGGKVSVTMSREGQNIRIEIEDTGVGIAPEHLASIFDRFWRADQARSRRSGGMGMGLAIAMAIAQRYQGKILVTSQLGTGSCFIVKLPIT